MVTVRYGGVMEKGVFCGLNISANRLELNGSLYLLQLLRTMTFCDFCQFAVDLENIHCGVMVCDENVSTAHYDQS